MGLLSDIRATGPKLLLDFKDILSTCNRYGVNEVNRNIMKKIITISNQVSKNQRQSQANWVIVMGSDSAELFHEAMEDLFPQQEE